MNTHQIIKAAIDANWARLNENWARQERVHVGAPAFLNDFATVTLNLGRRAGHTSYIARNAMPDDLIVVDREAEAREIRRMIASRHMPSAKFKIFSLAGYPDVFRGLKVRRIWIDNWSHMRYNIPASRLEEAYITMLYTNPEQIIRLG